MVDCKKSFLSICGVVYKHKEEIELVLQYISNLDKFIFRQFQLRIRSGYFEVKTSIPPPKTTVFCGGMAESQIGDIKWLLTYVCVNVCVCV